MYSGHFSPPWGGGILSKLKNREEFEGGLEKRKGKGEKRRKKKMTAKTGKNFRGGGNNLLAGSEYIPLV